MRLKLLGLATAAALLWGWTGKVGAGPITTLFSTGVDVNGNPLLDAAADPHYTLSGPQGGPAPLVVGNPAANSWVLNTATSNWVGPTDTGGFFGGNYVYKTTFDLTGFNPSTVHIDANLSADDQSTVLLNGNAVASSPFRGWVSFTPVSIGSGFKPGINTLEFDVPNTFGATGLQFQVIRATGSDAVAPEPSSMVLVGIGVAGLAGLAWRRKKPSA